MTRSYDVVIVGAGPGGLLAAHTLAGKGLKILVVDKGKEPNKRHCPEVDKGFCHNCASCDLMYGVGGSGLFSDGKLNLDPRIGGDLTEFTKTDEEAYALIDEVDQVFIRHGSPDELNFDEAATRRLAKHAAKNGIRFIPIKQRHIGSDHLPSVITNLMNELKADGIDFLLKNEASDIVAEKGRVKGIRIDGSTIKCENLLIATGRVGAKWLDQQARTLGIDVTYNPIDVGVRVEVPEVIMHDVTEINWDPKFHIRTGTYDDFVRTFCTCPGGYVVEERHDDFVLVNGHSMRGRHSQNTNFAFLTRIGLTEPMENTIAYGSSIAKLASTIGGGKPILQRLGDLRKGRRSNIGRIERSYVRPTLHSVTPGDISMALPSRIVTGIVEGLDMLDHTIPGVASDATLLYAPEVKFHAMRMKVGPSMETSLKGMFVAGDGAGVSRGIVQAAATGILAGKGILGK